MARALQPAMLAGVGPSADAPSASIAMLAAAFLAHVVASAMLVAGLPDLAVLHAYAAFVVLAIVAAAQQLVPVLFGVPAISAWISLAVTASFAGGFAALVGAFLGMPTIAYALPLLGIAAAIWILTTLERLVRARSERLTAPVLAASVAAFAVAVTFALTMLRGWPVSFPGWMPRAHGALMTLGFASTTIIALSFRFVPMFALAHATRERARMLSFAPIAAAVVVAVAPEARIVLFVVLVAMALLALVHLRTVRARMRKHIDMSLKYAFAAWSFGLLALAVLVADPANGRAALMLAVLGWLSLSIYGYGMKIIGFLAWQSARRRGVVDLAPLSSAIPERRALCALLALGAGAALLAVSSLTGLAIERVASVLYLFGALLGGSVLAGIAGRYLGARGSL